MFMYAFSNLKRQTSKEPDVLVQSLQFESRKHDK